MPGKSGIETNCFYRDINHRADQRVLHEELMYQQEQKNKISRSSNAMRKATLSISWLKYWIYRNRQCLRLSKGSEKVLLSDLFTG